MNKKLRITLVSVLLTLGLFFIFYNQITGFVYEKWLDKNQGELISGITSDSIKNNAANLDHGEGSFNYDEINSLSSGFILPKVDIDNLANAVGIITIPSIDLEEPILHGTTNQNLMIGATTMKPDQKMGENNYTLAGHNHLSRNVLFQPIRYAEIGAEIYVTDKDKVYTYKVINKEIVQPERVDVLDDVEGKKLITLVSCHADDGSDRIIVTGQLTEVEDYKE